ncbi:putative leucine-rich repeat receptor-like protein kinase [Glycine max]|nr:putative leucine-rich repeat receptor-like protein kinase [Glycine max]
MPKPPKSIFHHLLYNRRYSNPLSNSFVSNFILSSLTTHPPQHPHLRYTYFILMLALDRPTFCSCFVIKLLSLMDTWKNTPPNWVGSDPCDDWEGIKCKNSRITSILKDNPVCQENGELESYCSSPQPNFSYSTPPNNCQPCTCSSEQIPSPNCICAYPYSGTLTFRSLPFSDFDDKTYSSMLEEGLMQSFKSHFLPVDSDHFNRTGAFSIGFLLSNQTFKPPEVFGPFCFRGDKYEHFGNSEGLSESSKSSSIGIIIGAAVGGLVLLVLLLLSGLYAFRQKKRAEKAIGQSNPFRRWDTASSNREVPQLKEARIFSFEKLKKYTKIFSQVNDIGSGGFGKSDIIIHLTKLVPPDKMDMVNAGKSGIRLDWIRRLKIALGTARGLAYLHELVNPPIIHRDIKSNNILLDDRLNAKVADFGLSKSMVDSEKDHVTTQVKGTMGYLDQEYDMSQQLTEKSDVYSFGVLMLELISARRSLERGKYIVKEVKNALDKTKGLYGLHEIIDQAIGLP